MRLRALLGVLLILLSAHDARAQCTRDPNDTTNAGGSGTAGYALGSIIVLSAPTIPASPGLTHQEAIDAQQTSALYFSQALLAVVQREATTFPTGSSLGGFSYTFDPQLGLPVRRTESFGPVFADRPQSSGAHKFSMALSGERTVWRALGGVDLASGLTNIQAYPASQTNSGDPEIDYSRTQLTFSTNRTVLGLNYGLTSRIDVGMLLTAGTAVAEGTFYRTQTDLTTGQVLNVNGRHFCGASYGIGDVALRGKYEFLSRPTLDLALGIEVRVPTGAIGDALGVGSTQTKVTLIGALPRGSVAPHFNVGYTLVPGNEKGLKNFGSECHHQECERDQLHGGRRRRGEWRARACR